jgi:hypothetical protein
MLPNKAANKPEKTAVYSTSKQSQKNKNTNANTCYDLENNFQQHKEQRAVEAFKKYGNLGLIIETEK